MMKKMQEMQDTIDRLQNDDDDDDDDSIGSTDSDLLTKLAPVFANLFGAQNKKPTAMAGVAEDTEVKFTRQQVENFTKALKIMFKHNDQLDQDLLKLAAISENNPNQFTFLINALRNM